MVRNKKVLNITMSYDVLETLDEIRGYVPRSSFIESLVIERKRQYENQKNISKMMNYLTDKHPELLAKLFENGVTASKELSDDEIKQMMQL